MFSEILQTGFRKVLSYLIVQVIGLRAREW
jgi:hypothetical protein